MILRSRSFEQEKLIKLSRLFIELICWLKMSEFYRKVYTKMGKYLQIVQLQLHG